MINKLNYIELLTYVAGCCNAENRTDQTNGGKGIFFRIGVDGWVGAQKSPLINQWAKEYGNYLLSQLEY